MNDIGTRTRLASLVLCMALIIGSISINGCNNQGSKEAVLEGESMESLPESAAPAEGSEKTIVQQGDRVEVYYTGRLKDGTVFDKSQPGRPLSFTVGGGEMIPGFDRAVVGMKLNEEKEVSIEAKDAYGEKNEKLIQKLPMKSLPEGFKPEKGMAIKLKDRDGRVVPARITDIKADGIIIDLNHPLAGKDLIFSIKVVSID